MHDDISPTDLASSAHYAYQYDDYADCVDDYAYVYVYLFICLLVYLVCFVLC